MSRASSRVLKQTTTLPLVSLSYAIVHSSHILSASIHKIKSNINWESIRPIFICIKHFDSVYYLFYNFIKTKKQPGLCTFRQLFECTQTEFPPQILLHNMEKLRTVFTSHTTLTIIIRNKEYMEYIHLYFFFFHSYSISAW